MLFFILLIMPLNWYNNKNKQKKEFYYTSWHMGKNVFIQCILESSYEPRKTAKPYKRLKQNNGCRKVFGSRCFDERVYGTRLAHKCAVVWGGGVVLNF